MKFQVNKSSKASAAITEADMSLINAQAMVELTSEQVFVFRCEACNDQLDRDYERFATEALPTMAKLFVGRTVICDHRWSAANQQARIFAAAVEQKDGVASLVVSCYMLRNDSTKDVVAAIEGGILREVSVGCAMGRVTCSICGKDAYECEHLKGRTYDGDLCVYVLSDPIDAYELSFVAVPAQPGAGVTKNHNADSLDPAGLAVMKAQLELENEKWRFS